MKHMTRIRWITLGVAVFVIAFGVLLVVTVGRPAGNAHGDMVDRPAPALTFTSVDTNKPITTASLRGKAVIVNFWNTWCIPCRQEQPALQAFYSSHRNDPDFAMLGVVRSDTQSAVRSYAAR
jgi:cytochrome c biogenesis protein CcmG, thiol:disulfide interchange protein DsbE